MEGKINRLKRKPKVSSVPRQATESPDAKPSAVSVNKDSTDSADVIVIDELPTAVTTPTLSGDADCYENERRQAVQDPALKALVDILQAVDKKWKRPLESVPNLPPYKPPPVAKEDNPPRVVSMASSWELPPLPKMCPCKMRRKVRTRQEQSSDSQPTATRAQPKLGGVGALADRHCRPTNETVSNTNDGQKKKNAQESTSGSSRNRQEQEKMNARNAHMSGAKSELLKRPLALPRTCPSSSRAKIPNTSCKQDSQCNETGTTVASKFNINQHASNSKATKTVSSGLFSRVCEDDTDEFEGITNVHRVSNFPRGRDTHACTSSGLRGTSRSKTSDVSLGLFSTHTKTKP